MTDQSYRNCLFALTGGLLVFFCIACFGVVAISGGVIVLGEAIANLSTATPSPLPTLSISTNTATPVVTQALSVSATPLPTQAMIEQPTLAAANPTPRFTPASVRVEPIPAVAWESLEALWQTSYPHHDYYETALRLSNQRLDARTITTSPYNLGDRQLFYVGEDQIEAVLVAATEHAYFWVEVGLNLEPTEVNAAAQRFETEYYARITHLFGQEWRPGMDNDPHFSILHLADTGGNELGYFDSADQYPRAISEISNQQEIFYLNMGSLELGEDLYFGTMVHEYQHLIQWWLDPNETGWMNEGLSQLAETYVGLDTVETADYLYAPETQLNTWSYDENDEDAVYAHYAASYLFCLYLWEQLGDAAIQELARHPADGLNAVRDVLQGYRPDLTLEQLMGDFAAALWLDNPAAGPMYQFSYQRLNQPTPIQRITNTPTTIEKAANQYGIHYLPINRSGQYTIRFAGDTTVPLIPFAPHSGDKMWLAPQVDDMNAHLTATFDLTGLSAAALEFWAWYDLEEDYDFAYVTISTDGGATWDLLVPDHAETGDYGPALNGRSTRHTDEENGWVPESISLNRYTGQQVMIRFEVLTDGSVTGQGFAIDDLTIAALGYTTDLETDDGVWQAEGFVWTGANIPQQWVVQWIEDGRSPVVMPLSLDEFNQGEWTVQVPNEGGVLVVMPLTPFIYEPARYWVEIE